MKINFKQKVLNIVKKIPKGKTMTYKEVARGAKNPRAFRAVGNIVAKNFDPSIPCHRVIKSDGTFGNYNRGGTQAKIKILRKEGLPAGGFRSTLQKNEKIKMTTRVVSIPNKYNY